jgi:hypothetical protein
MISCLFNYQNSISRRACTLKGEGEQYMALAARVQSVVLWNNSLVLHNDLTRALYFRSSSKWLTVLMILYA